MKDWQQGWHGAVVPWAAKRGPASPSPPPPATTSPLPALPSTFLSSPHNTPSQTLASPWCPRDRDGPSDGTHLITLHRPPLWSPPRSLQGRKEPVRGRGAEAPAQKQVLISTWFSYMESINALVLLGIHGWPKSGTSPQRTSPRETPGCSPTKATSWRMSVGKWPSAAPPGWSSRCTPWVFASSHPFFIFRAAASGWVCSYTAGTGDLRSPHFLSLALEYRNPRLQRRHHSLSSLFLCK